MSTARQRTAELLEAQRPDDPWGRLVDVVLIVLIFANIVIIILETEPGLSAAWSGLFWRFEVFSVAVFTVGYGDVVPVTPLGKLFGGVISMVGIGMAALPAGILASGFASEMQPPEH